MWIAMSTSRMEPVGILPSVGKVTPVTVSSVVRPSSATEPRSRFIVVSVGRSVAEVSRLPQFRHCCMVLTCVALRRSIDGTLTWYCLKRAP